MSLLFSPITIKSVALKNRIVMSPMCQYSAIAGFANDWHTVHYATRAVGGCGLIIVEATAVQPEGRISYADLGIWSDEHIAALQNITSLIHKNGSVAGIQIAHAGRKASCEVAWKGGRQIKEGVNSWTPVAPSPIPFHEQDITPHELNISEIKNIINDFKNAAKRALEAGFKVLEIHAAHGYLIHEFYSPLCNKRTDKYGGSFENRIRFLLEIVDTVNEVWPKDLPLFVRISATDWVTDGWTLEDSIVLAKLLKTKDVDVVDCSSAANSRKAEIPVAPNYQVPLSNGVKHGAGILTGAVGLITEANQAEAILQREEADLIFLGRQLLRDPYFPLHAAKLLGEELQWPLQYERGR